MGGAVEMCSGLGACRKTLDGTMCPSYMATREEEHSTRGRANVLRLAMAGQLGEAGLGDEGVCEVLDLCLECRACKAECPVGVDVARFKSEFLADYWQRHGTPLRARVLGHVHELCALGQPSRAALELVARSAPAAGSNERSSASIAAACRRRGPATFRGARVASASGVSAGLAKTPTLSCLQRHVHELLQSRGRHGGARRARARGLRGGAGAERLLRPAADLAGPARRGARARAQSTPTRCIRSPSRAAARLLRAELPVGDARGCARAAARRGAAEGAAVAEACVLVRGVRSKQQLATGAPVARSRAGPAEDPAPRPLPSESDGPAGAGEGAARRAFPASTVVDLDAGCCGMAGSFGYAREHFDVSRAIGERRLLPAARRRAPATVLVASGVSCRHQVEDFTGDRALHPAELLRSFVQETA